MRFISATGKWNLKELREVAPLQRGFDLPSSQVKSGNVPVVYSNGILRYHNQGKAIGPGVITGRSGTIGKFTYIGDGAYWPHNTSLWVTDFKGNCPLFVYYLLQSVGFEKYATGSGVPTLNRNDVMKHVVGVPGHDEQRAIAEFLSLVDRRIAIQNKIIEELRFLIDELCLQFKPSQTFCLQDICECKTSVLKESEIASEGLYPVYGATGRCGYLDKPLFDKPGVAVVKDGAGVGRCFQIKDKGFSTLGTIALLVPKKDVPPEYLWVAVKSISFTKYIVGSGIPHVYFKDYKAALVPAITSRALTLSKLCESLFLKMEIESKKLDQLYREKAYLLCNLFI